MKTASILDDKSVLIVDDEVDVLETLKDLLPMCDIVTASSYEEARRYLENKWFEFSCLLRGDCWSVIDFSGNFTS